MESRVEGKIVVHCKMHVMYSMLKHLQMTNDVRALGFKRGNVHHQTVSFFSVVSDDSAVPTVPSFRNTCFGPPSSDCTEAFLATTSSTMLSKCDSPGLVCHALGPPGRNISSISSSDFLAVSGYSRYAWIAAPTHRHPKTMKVKPPMFRKAGGMNMPRAKLKAPVEDRKSVKI